MLYKVTGTTIDEAVADYGDLPLRFAAIEDGEFYLFESGDGRCRLHILPFEDQDIADLLSVEAVTLRTFADVFRRPRLSRYSIVSFSSPTFRVRIERQSRLDNVIETEAA